LRGAIAPAERHEDFTMRRCDAAMVERDDKEGHMIDWWAETDRAILDCLRNVGPMSPVELARHVGISEGEAEVFVAMLAREGKLRIRLVELSGSPAPLPGMLADERGLVAR
jgi:AsnC-type helix-turn-helix domain